MPPVVRNHCKFFELGPQIFISGSAGFMTQYQRGIAHFSTDQTVSYRQTERRRRLIALAGGACIPS
jgi:hypothetical protein